VLKLNSKQTDNSKILLSRFCFLNSARGGFTVVEVILVIGIIAIISTISLISLSGRRGTSQLDGTVRQIGSLIREAQSKSVSQVNGTTWGVVFDNTTTSEAFYGMFKGTAYTTTSSVSFYGLPANVVYATSTIPAGSRVSVYFSQVSGLPSASVAISLLLQSPSLPSSTISVNSLGAVSF
jgi:prepilin-type N-terminal cleavage/methylation domain-containing protein